MFNLVDELRRLMGFLHFLGKHELSSIIGQIATALDARGIATTEDAVQLIDSAKAAGMTKGGMLKYLTEEAAAYRTHAHESIKRNCHMNRIQQDDVILQRIVDALLVDFINRIGVNMGVDYGLYTKNLIEEEQKIKNQK